MTTELSQFGLLAPHALSWTMLVALLVLVLLRAETSRRKALHLLGLSASVRGTSRICGSAGLCLILVGALLRPYWGAQRTTIKAAGQDILLLIDVSQSMLAEDPAPSRLEIARRKAEDLLSLLAAKQRADRVGLVLFAGASYLYCPLTLDSAVLRTYLRSISTDLISAPGSNLTAGVRTALAAAKDAGAASPIIIILGDGEDADFNLADIERGISESSARIFSIGIGSSEGKPIALSDGTFVKDSKGSIVISKLDRVGLSAVAKSSSGTYQDVTLDDSDLLNVLARTADSQTNPQHEQAITVYNELGPLLVCLVLVLMLLALLTDRRGVVFCVALGLWLLPGGLVADEAISLYQAYKAYQAQDYEQAARGFSDYLKAHPHDLRVRQSLASAQYKLGRFNAARGEFERSTRDAGTQYLPPTERADLFYNLGNAQVQAKDFKGAISNYEKALEFNPNDPEAKHNLEVAKRLLERQKQEQQQQSESESDSQNSPDSRAQGDNTSQASESKPTPNSEQRQGEDQDSDHDTPQRQDPERDHGNRGDDEQQNQKGSTGIQGAQDEKALSKREAETWLDSLQDSPVLLQKENSRSRNYVGQTW